MAAIRFLPLLALPLLGATLSLRAQEVVLSPEKYKELTSKLEEFKKQAAQEKPIPPSMVEIAARLEKAGDTRVAKLAITYRFDAPRPRAPILLGLRNAFALSAKYSGGALPAIEATEGGLVLTADKAGPQTVEIAVDAPVASRGLRSNEVGFDLNLPGSAITLLKFAVPDGVTRARVGRREASAGPVENKRYTSTALALNGTGEAIGPATYLEIGWDEGPAAAGRARTASADWDVQVRDTEIRTQVKLTLRGPAREWRIAAPATAELTVARAAGAGAETLLDPPPAILRPEAGQPSIWRIAFPEVATTDLLVTIVGTQARPKETKAKGFVPLGPVGVLDLSAQSGFIRIVSSALLKVKEVPRGDTRRQVGAEDPNEINLRYTLLAAGPNGIPLSPADLDIRPAVGVVSSRARTTLTLGDAGWRYRSEITMLPVRSEIDRVEFLIPAATDFRNVLFSPPELVEAVENVRERSGGERQVVVRLSAPKRSAFQIVLEGLYPLPATARQTRLRLPLMPQTTERDGQIVLATPEGMEAAGLAREWDGDKPGTWTARFETVAGVQSSRLARAIGEVELTWKPKALPASGLTIVDASLRDSKFHVEVESKVLFAGAPPARMRWKTGSAVPLTVRTAGGSVEVAVGGELALQVPAGGAKEAVFRFVYDVPTPANAAESEFVVPLFRPMIEGGNETRVRFWGDDASTSKYELAPTTADWRIEPLEIVPDRDTLPLLVLGGADEAGSVRLAMRSVEKSPGAPDLWIDRILAQAQSQDQAQRYRVRLFLRRWSRTRLAFEIPADATDVACYLNGKILETRTGDSPGSLLIELPGWKADRNSILEFRYVRPGNLVGFAEWRLPRALFASATGVCRWQVALPGRAMPLSLGGAEFEETWSLRAGIPFPVAARSLLDMERWFNSGEEPTQPAGWQIEDAGITARQSGDGPLRALLLPRFASLLLLSGLACAMAYVFSVGRTRLRWAVVAVAAAAVLAVNIWNSQWFLPLFACTLPGLFLSVMTLAVLRYRDWRYETTLRRMPGFQRSVVPDANILSSTASAAGRQRQPGTRVEPPLSAVRGSP